jgi:hypothetical protein
MPPSDIYRGYIRFKERDKKWQDLSGFNKRVIAIDEMNITSLRIDRQSGCYMACISDTNLFVFSMQGESILNEATNNLSQCMDIYHQINEKKLIIAAGFLDG